jgi:hypothetical protein
MSKLRALGPVLALVLVPTASGGCSSGPSDGTAAASGGAPIGSSGGQANTSGGAMTTGGTLPAASGGTLPGSSGGSPASGGANSGGDSNNSSGGGGPPASGGGGNSGGVENSGGAPGVGGGGDGSGGFTGTCTPSTSASGNVPNTSGAYDVVIELNEDPGIEEGTIYRPTDLGEGKKYPIFVWGQGGCSRNSNTGNNAMAETASHGYFVVADGTPGGNQANRPLGGGGEFLLQYVDWLISENSKPCSAYYQHIDTTKIAANGFSCGGLMSSDTAADPRMTTWGHTSSGSFSVNQAFYNSIHSPVIIITGTEDSTGATANGQRDYDNIEAQGDIPVMMFSKIGADHGGDLFSQRGGDFTKINIAWLNWWLKGDETATGKGLLVGANCPYCSDNTWTIQSANLP